MSTTAEGSSYNLVDLATGSILASGTAEQIGLAVATLLMEDGLPPTLRVESEEDSPTETFAPMKGCRPVSTQGRGVRTVGSYREPPPASSAEIIGWTIPLASGAVLPWIRPECSICDGAGCEFCPKL